MELEKIDLEDWADLCQAFFVYARGGDFRAEPVGDVLRLITELVGLGRYDCRLNFVEDWRTKMLNHGLDPATGQLFDRDSFEVALRELVAKNQRRRQIKEAHKAKREAVELSSESSGESSVKVLTPLATGQPQEVAPMLRAIRNKLGPTKAAPKPLAQQFPPTAPDPSTTFATRKRSDGTEIEAVEKSNGEPDWFARRYGWAQGH
jgi:hypothetical protein